MKSFRLFLFFLFFPVLSFAGILKGTIKDKKGEALPFATVFIQGTTTGTSANAQGEYQLTIPPGTHKVACQYIGYQQVHFAITIEGNETVVRDFTLPELDLKMKEYVVKASEDPAVYIMKQVIARRSFHQNQVRTFETDIYLKGVLKTRETPKKVLGQKIDAAELGLDSNRKGILYLCEEDASYYTQNGKERTVIHAVKESGNPNGLGFSQFPPVMSFYESSVKISPQITPRGLISPLNDFAFNYYKFRLEGDFEENSRTIYKIRVTPRRLHEPLFSGILYIVDNEWAIHSLSLTATKKSNIELFDTLRISQVYLPQASDLWVIKQQVLYPTIKIFGFDLTGNFVTVYNNQKVNQQIPDSIFNNKIISSYDKNATKKNSVYWSETRPVPLLEDEHRDYVVKDSVGKIYDDPANRDSLRRRLNMFKPIGSLISGYTYRGKEYKLWLGTNSLLSDLVNYNTIEGLNVALKTTGRYRIDTTHFISGAVVARYGFSNTHFNSIGRLVYTERKKDWIGRNWSVGIEGGKYVFQFNPYNPISPFFNTLSTLFLRKNHMKIYERWNGAVLLSRNYGTGLKWSGKLDFQQRIPIENTTDYSFAKESTGGFTDNIPAEFRTSGFARHNALLMKFSVTYQPGYTYVQYPDYIMPNRSRFPVFTLSYVKAVPDVLDSKTDFDKWSLAVKDKIGLKLLGNVAYNMTVGGFLNRKFVSIPDLNHINGNDVILATPYLESFQLAPYYQFSNSEPLHGEFHAEWHLKGFLTNNVPILRQMRWYLVTGTNAYYVNDRLYHVEYFAGIDNLGYDKFRVLRLDVVQSFSSLSPRMTAIRIGIAPEYIKVNINNTSEW